MAKSNICGDCHHFSDVGRCRIGSFSKRDLVAFFADACPYFTREPEQPAPETKKEMETETPTTKVCKKCGRELPLESFGKNKNGHLNICKECRSKIQKEAWAKRHEKEAEKDIEKARKEFQKTLNKPKKDKGPVQKYKIIPASKFKKPTPAPLTPEEVEAHKQDALLGILRTATDQDLANELTRRGYRGHLTKTLINEE